MASAALLRKFFRPLLALTVAAAAPASAQLPGLANERKIEEFLAPVVSTNNFAGVVVIARADEIIFSKAYGQASAEHNVPHRPDTRFRIASVSKPFTTAAILLLAERGKLDLHAPLSRLLPGYPNGDRLTVHHLMSHTSGIPNINVFPEYDDIQLRRHSTEQLVKYFRDKPLDFVPGERFAYSNSNFNLLAHIIERVSGQSYGDFLSQAIFGPLALSNTGHPQSMGQIIPRLAEGYAPEGLTGLQRASYVDWSVKTGNGSLFSSASDLIRFFRAINEGRLLTPQSMAAAFTQHTPNVGYGWFITKANGRDIRHINGRSPGWAAQVDYYVAEKVTIAVLSNTYSSVTTPIARGVGAILFGEPHQPFPNLSDRRLSAAETRPLEGLYLFGPDYYVPNQKVRILARDGVVYATYPGSDYPASAYIPITAKTFIARPWWSDVEFVTGSDGVARELVFDGFKAKRAEGQ